METEAPPPIEPSPKPRPSKLPIVAGFIIGALPWAIAFANQRGYDGIPFLLFACFVEPVIAVVLAIIQRTRPFGLGLLLASGLGWLVLGAMCGGLLR